MNKNSTTKKHIGYVKKFALTAISLLITLPAFAQENIISSVMISKSKDKANAYELNIDSTQAVQYKAHIEENGSIYFDLKNSVISDDIGTIYDDVTNIDNVTVKQLDRNKVRIYIKGANAKNTELVFINSLFEPNEHTKKLIINRPISQYHPVNSYDLDNQEEIQDWDDNSFNFAHLGTTFLKNTQDKPIGIALIVLSVFAIIGIFIKTISSKLSQEKEPLISLNSQKYLDNTLALGTTTISKQTKSMPKTQELASVAHKNQTLKNAQAELKKAHQKYQDYLQNKYKDNYKYKLNSVNIDAIKKGIALNQYQKSTQNPYINQEVIKIKKEFTQKPLETQGNFQIPPRPKKQVNSDFTSPYIQKPAPKMPNLKSANKETNMKFLESVTKIYEQSGRGDLASGLKNSISKAKQSI